MFDRPFSADHRILIQSCMVEEESKQGFSLSQVTLKGQPVNSAAGFTWLYQVEMKVPQA